MASANQHFRKCVELCREHGLGRIEVANLSMVPATRIYLNELRPALKDGRAAAAAAARVGHHRAELVAHSAACTALRMLGELSSAHEHMERRGQVHQRVGGRRFATAHMWDAEARQLSCCIEGWRSVERPAPASWVHCFWGSSRPPPRTLKRVNKPWKRVRGCSVQAQSVTTISGSITLRWRQL